tara:strand:+ start:406 stop:852 length:447 start_codon:yes stop_codon:yes gene_type:complete
MVKLLKIKKMNYKIIGKYIKNLDFEIPNPKTFFLLSKNISNYKINIDIKSNQIKEEIIEIQITLRLIPNEGSYEKINIKIVYSSLIEIEKDNNKKEEIEKIILIDVPTKVYPEIRKIFIFMFENSGFKDIKINENVDFQKLYNLKKVQ